MSLSGLQWTVIVFALSIGTAVVLGSNRQEQERKQQATDAAAVVGEIASGQIADGFAFQQHCGRAARMTKVGKDLALFYPEQNVSVNLLRADPSDSQSPKANVSFWRADQPGASLDAPAAVSALGCKP